jgi:hypothetical protein
LTVLYRLFVATLWLALTNGIIFTPDPNPLVAGDKNFSLTFTLEAGNPQLQYEGMLTLEGFEGLPTIYQFHLDFQNHEQETLTAADLNIPFAVLG